MSGYELPKISDVAGILPNHFPTQMQAVVFRMWDMVPKAKLAKIMETTIENIDKLAKGLGLPEQTVHPDWKSKGYITIIRSAWHILPYEQILDILEWDEFKLAYILKEDDFLDLKLGAHKPSCPKVVYRELTEDEQKKTGEFLHYMTDCVNPYCIDDAKKPFDLFCRTKIERIDIQNQPENTVQISDSWTLSNCTQIADTDFYTELFLKDFSDMFGYTLKKGNAENSIELYVDSTISAEEEYFVIDATKNNIKITSAQPVGVLRGLMYIIRTMTANKGPYVQMGHFEVETEVKSRVIYSFCGLYTNTFEVAPEISYPEELLRSYARIGINGVFTQLLMYKMAEFPFDTSISEGWQDRLERLKQTVALLKKYGIKLFFYVNEPRALSLSFFEKYPDLKGFEYEGNAHLCTSTQRVQQYMDEAIYSICNSAPDIGGFFVTTRSENHTNCYSHIYPYNSQNCPRCINRTPAEVIAEVCNIINRAAKRANQNIITIAATWEWMSIFSHEDFEECLKLLDSDIPLERVSEEGLEFECGGIQNSVIDYTMSKPAPSKASLDIFETGNKYGHEAMAKVQFNNTWECSTVPYIPIYREVWEHAQRLKKAGVNHFMLSWTLGGYPSPTLDIVHNLYYNVNGSTKDYETSVKKLYGEYGDSVLKAVDEFGKSFKEFPFDVQTAYLGPHNACVSTLLYKEPTGYEATMTCYCYDDLENWRSKYPVDVYENQHRLMYEIWHNGMKYIENMPDCEFKDVSKACELIWLTCYNQIKYIRLRNEYISTQNKELLPNIINIVSSEEKLAGEYYVLMQKNPAIGYEPANHYYYNLSMIAEKIISCRHLINEWKKEI